MNYFAKKFTTIATIIAPSLLFSNEILSRIIGSVGLEYVQDKSNSTSRNTKTTSLSKVVNLGYNDFIYSPNLLEYAIHTKFDSKESKTTNNDQEADSSSEATDYKLRIDFLKNSRYPVSLNVTKSAKPKTDTNSSGILETNFNQEDYSLTGAVYLDKTFDMNYVISTNTRESTTATTKQNVADNTYNFNVNKSFGNLFLKTYTTHFENESESTDGIDEKVEDKFKVTIEKVFTDYTLRADVVHEIEDNTKNYDTFNDFTEMKNEINTSFISKFLTFDIEYETNEKKNSVDTTSDILTENILTDLRWTLSPKVTIDNSLSTLNQKKANITNFSEYFNIQWKPTNTYNLGMGLFTNVYKEATDTLTNNGLSLNSSYDITRFLSTDQSFSYDTANSNTEDSEDYFLNLSVGYQVPIMEKSILNLRTGATGLLSSGVNEVDNGSTYTYDVTAGITTAHNINTIHDYKVNYRQSFSDLTEEEQKVRFDSAFETKFIYDISYLSNIDYTHRITHALENRSSSSSDNEDITEKVLNVFNGIKISENLDIRGRLDANLGLKYSRRQKTNEDTFSTVAPDGTANFSYRLWRTMQFRSILNINRDSATEITTYRSETSLIYKFRKLSIELGNSIHKQKGGTSGNVSTSNYTFIFKRSL